MDERTEQQREEDRKRWALRDQSRVDAIKTDVKAVINARYEHLGNQVTIEAEGYSNAALIVIMEMIVKELKHKL
jgi:hypothetical protein